MPQGWNDYPLRPQRAIDYLDEVNNDKGGARTVREFFLLFMVPGMLHCHRGPGAWDIDYLDPLVDWVVKGKVPEFLVGIQPKARFTRRHCVYPSTAHFNGDDLTKADSYTCRLVIVPQ